MHSALEMRGVPQIVAGFQGDQGTRVQACKGRETCQEERSTAGATRSCCGNANVNFQGYDSYPVIDEYHHQKLKIEQVRNGAKVLSLQQYGIRFIDSSFFQMPLSAFPETFGLTQLKKGYFPHLFNTHKNAEYVGPIPAKDYYMPEGMSVKGPKDFKTLHAEQVSNNVRFHFAEELVNYCESDVRLLKEGCLTFKRLFKAKTGFNQIAIASVCNRDLHKNRMIPESISSKPLNRWRMTSRHSRRAIEWVLWREHCLQQAHWMALTVDECEVEDMMVLVYPNTAHLHHLLWRSYIRHAHNEGEHLVQGLGFVLMATTRRAVRPMSTMVAFGMGARLFSSVYRRTLAFAESQHGRRSPIDREKEADLA